MRRKPRLHRIAPREREEDAIDRRTKEAVSVYVRLRAAGGASASTGMTRVLEGVLRGAARAGSLDDALEAIGSAWPAGGETPAEAKARHVEALAAGNERQARASALVDALAAVDPGLSRGTAAAVAALRPGPMAAVPGVDGVPDRARWTLDAPARAAFDLAVRRADGSKGPYRKGGGIVFSCPRTPPGPDGRREWDVMVLGLDEGGLALVEAGGYVGAGRRPPACSLRAEVAVDGRGTATWDVRSLPAIACGNYRVHAAPGCGGDPVAAFAEAVRSRHGFDPVLDGDVEERPDATLRVARSEIDEVIGRPEASARASNPVVAALAVHREAVVHPLYEHVPGRGERVRDTGERLQGEEALKAIGAGFGRRSAFRSVALDAAVAVAIGRARPASTRLLRKAVAVSQSRATDPARAGAEIGGRDAGGR